METKKYFILESHSNKDWEEKLNELYTKNQKVEILKMTATNSTSTTILLKITKHQKYEKN